MPNGNFLEKSMKLQRFNRQGPILANAQEPLKTLHVRMSDRGFVLLMASTAVIADEETTDVLGRADELEEDLRNAEPSLDIRDLLLDDTD